MRPFSSFARNTRVGRRLGGTWCNLWNSLISSCYAWPNRGNPPKPPRECETRRSQPGGFLHGRAILPSITPSLNKPFRWMTRGRTSGRSGSLQTSYSDRLLPVLTLANKNKTLAHNNKTPACISAISPVASSRPDCRPFSTEASAIHGGAHQPEVDARIFNNVRKADLANMKIPRWWRIPPIAG
jgi:hypothetical protein